MNGIPLLLVATMWNSNIQYGLYNICIIISTKVLQLRSRNSKELNIIQGVAVWL